MSRVVSIKNVSNFQKYAFLLKLNDIESRHLENQNN